MCCANTSLCGGFFILNHALKYARLGRPVFPCGEDKRPLTLNGFKDASTDPGYVSVTWKLFPNALIGSPTGNGTIVIDIDGPDGEEALQSLSFELSDLPETRTASTGRGRHLYYRVPCEIRNSAGKLGTGVDVRGDGGYVILPPSPHPNGLNYQWINEGAVADLPPDWLAVVRDSAAPTQVDSAGPSQVTDAPQPIPQGMRNSHLASLAGTMRRRGMEASSILAAIQSENRTRCFPPLPDREVEQIAYSYSRYKPGKDEKLAEVKVPGILGSDVKAQKIDWLWKGFLPSGRVVILEGDPGLGKSTVAIDMCARLTTASAMPLDAPGVPVPCGAVYVSLEDSPEDTLAPRAICCGADMARIRFISEIDGLTPTIPRDIGLIEMAVRSVGARLLVLDPLVGMLEPGKTDSHRDQDVRRALAPLSAMAQRNNLCVLIIRHLNKSHSGNAKYRGGGSIGIGAAARASFLVAKIPDSEECAMVPVKENLAKARHGLRFTIREESITGGIESTRIDWLGHCHLTADQLSSPPKNNP